MFRSFAFPFTGLIYLLLLWIPNFIWARNIPARYEVSGESKVLVVLERIGQVLVTASLLLVPKYWPVASGPWWIWLLVSAVLMLFYELNWIRYFRSARTLSDFYRPFFNVPVPGATLPVFALLSLGIYTQSIFLIIATAIFGIGHISIHLLHVKAVGK